MKAKDNVNISNDLVRAAHNLNLMEKRLLMLCISKIDSKRSYVEPVPNIPITLTVIEFQNAYDLPQKSVYIEAKKACMSLQKRFVRFFHKSAKGNRLETVISWLTKATYADAEGWIQISINGELAPYLIELKNHFTSYKLNRVSAFRSVYSWRLFELVQQFKKTGVLKISIEDFAKTLELSESYITDFYNMKSRVIIPAITEIREKDGLDIAWTTATRGKKVVALTFTFSPEQAIASAKKLKAAQATMPAPLPKKTRQAVAPADNYAQLVAEFKHLQQLATLSQTPLEALASEAKVKRFKAHQLL